MDKEQHTMALIIKQQYNINNFDNNNVLFHKFPAHIYTNAVCSIILFFSSRNENVVF